MLIIVCKCIITSFHRKRNIIFEFFPFFACKSTIHLLQCNLLNTRLLFRRYAHSTTVTIKRQGGAIMAKCAICEKAAHFGNNVSHSHRRSNKMWKSNVKSVKIKTAEGGARKTYVCTSCLRSGKVERA